MKKFKMIVSVFMVMVLMLSAFSFTASAASTNQPKASYMMCPECNHMTARYIRSVTEVLSTFPVMRCEILMDTPHNHENHHRYDVFDCSNCGRVEVDFGDSEYCAEFGAYI